MTKSQTYYKLTDQDGYTRRGYANRILWVPGETYRAKGKGKGRLCTSRCIHGYESLELGLMLNPVHANIENPTAFEITGRPTAKDWSKVGFRTVVCGPELSVPKISPEMRTRFAIYCAKQVIGDICPEWSSWAEDWLSGKDRPASATSATCAACATASAAKAAKAAFAAKAASAAKAADAAAAGAVYAAWHVAYTANAANAAIEAAADIARDVILLKCATTVRKHYPRPPRLRR